jgi:hypothetical protein
LWLIGSSLLCSFRSQVAFAMWFGIVNTFVHTLMYYYYFVASFSTPPKWGKYLTQLQMIQMVIGAFSAVVPVLGLAVTYAV